MKVSQLIKDLQELKEKFGDLDVIYAKDDEGNSYNFINHHPSVGEFYSKDKEFNQIDEGIEIKFNAICVN